MPSEPVRHSTVSVAETHWLSTVASATPATPMPSTHTNSRSPSTFITPAAIRKYSGRRVSPTARSTAAPKL